MKHAHESSDLALSSSTSTESLADKVERLLAERGLESRTADFRSRVVWVRETRHVERLGERRARRTPGADCRGRLFFG